MSEKLSGGLMMADHFGCIRAQTTWLDVRVFHVKVANCPLDDTPEVLTMRYPPRDICSALEVNGGRISRLEELELTLHRDRLDTDSAEATYMSMDNVRASGAVSFEVYDKELPLLSGNFDGSGSSPPTCDHYNDVNDDDKFASIATTLENPAKVVGWKMNLTCIVSSTGSAFLKGRQEFSDASLSAAPTMEVNVVGRHAGSPVTLSEIVQLNVKRKDTLHAIVEGDERKNFPCDLLLAEQPEQSKKGNITNKGYSESANEESLMNLSDQKSSRVLSGDAKRKKSELDCIVVGAGVAGAALASTLGMDGRRVLVIERDLTEPDRIVGELLQPGGYLKLVELGLADCVDGIDAQKVFGYALFKDGRDAKVGYPLEGFSSDIAGRSFHNGRFIQKMRAKAASIETVDLQQGTVLSLIEENGTVEGVRYKSKAEDGSSQVVEAFAPLTFVCDGCFSNLRRNLCTPQVDVPSCFVGLVLENCDLPHANHGHVVLADPSTILFYPISSTEVRCLVDIPGQKVPSIANGEMAKYLTERVAPQLPEMLQKPFIAAVLKGNIRTMPNKSMPALPRPTPGALLMGDAFNMRHPLTGGGMTVALSDILVLRDMLKPLLDFNDASAMCDYLKAFYTRRKPVASTINTLAGALYKVFMASPDEAMKEMRQACFDYLSLGGVFSSGPVALLSGLNPRPLSLVTHFFAVALFGVGRLMLPFPSLKGMWIGMRLLKGASKIIIPIIISEGVMQMFFPALLPDHYNAPPLQ